MINLKQLLKELTSHNFKVNREENPSAVGSVLNKIGFRGLGIGKTYKWIKTFEGGKMFVHIQYHVVATHLGQFKLHQRQLYLRDRDVNVTDLYVDKLTEPYAGKGYTMKTKRIGNAYVDTDKFLAALKRVDVIARAS